MIIISKIVGIDNKFGRKSRTGSNISIGVKDELAHDAQTYLMALEKDGELTGKIKKIELVIYEDGDELETIESLRATNKDLREFIDNLDTVVKNSEPLIDSVVIVEETGVVNLESLDHLNYQYNQGWISQEYYDKTKKELLEPENEHLPAHQLDLPLYKEEIPKPCQFCVMNLDGSFCKLACRRNPESKSDVDLFEVIPMSQRIFDKPCECETSAIVNGKCANCGGVE